MDRELLEERILQLAREIAGRDLDPAQPVDLDSLERAEIAFVLERELGAPMPWNLMFRTFGEAAERIAAAAAAHGSGSEAALRPGIGRLNWLGRAVMGPVIRGYFRLEVRGAQRVPRRGPAILAMNHDSLLDIPALCLSLPRPIFVMAKAELFEKPVGAWLFHALGGFPVRRGGYDLRAVRAAVETVERGVLLSMYPEGTRAPVLQPFLPGAAWVALATGAPLIPAAVTGTAESMPRGSSVPRRSRIVVRFGEPMTPAREEEPRVRLERARVMTGELRSEIEALLES